MTLVFQIFEKFGGDNKISFMLSAMQFKVKLNAMGTADENGKWNFLLCCSDSVAFCTVSDAIILNRDVTYAECKTLLNEKFCKTEYRQNCKNSHS